MKIAATAALITNLVLSGVLLFAGVHFTPASALGTVAFVLWAVWAWSVD